MKGLSAVADEGVWPPFYMSANYSSEGHPGINTAHKHRMLRVLVYIFWKISLCHSVSCSLLHESCASNVLNKRLRKFDRSSKERWTVAHHRQAAFWCQFLGEVMPVRRAREAVGILGQRSFYWYTVTSSRFWVLGCLALAQKNKKEIPTWQNN